MFLLLTVTENSTYAKRCSCLSRPSYIDTCSVCRDTNLQRLRSCELLDFRNDLRDTVHLLSQIGEDLVRKCTKQIFIIVCNSTVTNRTEQVLIYLNRDSPTITLWAGHFPSEGKSA